MDARVKPGHDGFVCKCKPTISVSSHNLALSPRVRASFCSSRSPLRNQRAQGMPGARCTRSLACKIKCAYERSYHGHTGNARHSPRNGFTAYSALSPVIGRFCHRRRQNCFRRLDAGVEASGPHDFAVRVRAIRQERTRVHRIPHPTSVTIAKRPSRGAGCESIYFCFYPPSSEISENPKLALSVARETTSFRDGPKDQTRNLEILRCATAHHSSMLRIAPE